MPNNQSYQITKERVYGSLDIKMSSSSIEITRLYISNLNFSTTEAELSDYLRQYSVVSVLIPSQTIRGFRSNQVRPLGIAYAEFESSELLKRAIDQLNGKEFKGRDLKLKPYVPYSPEHVTRKMNKSKTLCKLRHLKKHYKIEPAVEPAAEITTEPSCEEPDPLVQEEVVQELNAEVHESAAEIEGQNNEPAEEPEAELSEDTVYLGYLPKGCTDVELREHFKEFKPQEIWIFRTRSTKSRHLRFRRHFIAALVRLKTPEKMNTVIERTDRKKLMGKKQIVKPAITKKIHEMKRMAAEKKNMEESNCVVFEVEDIREPGEPSEPSGSNASDEANQPEGNTEQSEIQGSSEGTTAHIVPEKKADAIHS